MSDLSVKAAVRKRDGHRCCDCGMTNDEHLDRYGSILEVHRLLPGSDYLEFWCVTLCRECHDKKPSNITAVVLANDPDDVGILTICLNLYHPEHRHIWGCLRRQMEVSGALAPEDLMTHVLLDWCARLPDDYSI